MWFFEAQRQVKLSGAFAALLLCSACGGGGASTSSTTPPAAVNQAPSVTISAKSIIAEGQPFDLDASGSTDRDGDSLSYNWRQVSGPAIEISSPDASKLSLVAPMLEADETVSFEVTVSDGALSEASVVTLDMEDVKPIIRISESTEFGTGGPTNPNETVPDPSIYEGNKPLDQIIGITASGEGDYTVHWTAGFSGHDMPISSQAFTADGEKVGDQVDGAFTGGVDAEYDRENQTLNHFTFGITFATVQSGDTLYNFNGVLDFGEVFTIGYTSYRGLVEGEVDGFGDVLIEPTEYSQRQMGGAYTPIGESDVLLTLSERTTDDAEDPDAKIFMTSWVVDKFGQVVTHDLGEYESNGTANEDNRMAATTFGNDSYLVAWTQNTVDSAYDLFMQRVTDNGILLGDQIQVNENTEGNQLLPSAVTMDNGNVFMTWLNVTEDEEAGRELRGRIISPEGSFLTDEAVLGPALPTTFNETSVNRPFYNLLALETNEVLLTWGGGTAEGADLRAMVFDTELNAASNEFLIATGDQSERIRDFRAAVLPDNRVILGWFNDYLYGDERPDTSHTVGFYPVGKE